MSTGPGFLDSNDIWQYGEDDSETLMSDLLNLGQIKTSEAFTQDRARLDELESGTEVHLQLDTANSVVRMVRQIGIGKVQGAGSGIDDVTKAVTFPVPFKAGTTPVAVSSFRGYRNAGAFDPVGLVAATALSASCQLVTPAGFVLKMINPTGGYLSASFDWYFQWEAYGEMS